MTEIIGDIFIYMLGLRFSWGIFQKDDMDIELAFMVALIWPFTLPTWMVYKLGSLF